MKVDKELNDPETMELIQQVIAQQFSDPAATINEDEAMFALRFNDFERKDKRARNHNEIPGGRQRAQATKRVRDAYHIEREKREKEEELKRLEQEAR